MKVKSSKMLLKPLLLLVKFRHALWRRFNSARRMDIQRRAFYRGVWREAAHLLGAAIEDLGNDVLEIRLGNFATRVQGNYTAIDGLPTLKLAGNKPLVLRMLSERGLCVPRWRQFDLSNVRLADDFMRKLHGDCVVKPACDTGAGMGVTTHVSNRWQLWWAVAAAAAHGDELLIEEQIAGDNYRLLYLDGALIDAVQRRPPSLVGDGRSTVRTLVRRANESRLASGAEAAQTLIRCDLDMRHTLASQDLTIESVPAAGQEVRLKTVINDNSALENVAATTMLCDEVVAAGAAAAAAVGAGLAGVDIITSDPGRPLDEVGGAIVEVNTTPGFYYHYHRQGEPRTIAVDVLRHLLRRQDGMPHHQEHADVGCL